MKLNKNENTYNTLPLLRLEVMTLTLFSLLVFISSTALILAFSWLVSVLIDGNSPVNKNQMKLTLIYIYLFFVISLSLSGIDTLFSISSIEKGMV